MEEEIKENRKKNKEVLFGAEREINVLYRGSSRCTVGYRGDRGLF